VNIPRAGPGLGFAQHDFASAPFTIAWEITRACPLRCVHCRADAQPHRDPRELTTEEGLTLVADAAAMGTRVLVITGGDPLARPDVFELLRAVDDAHMHAGFSPSVTPRLTRDTLARALDAGAATIHLSLDGASAETHDGFRQVHGSFDRTCNAIQTVHDLGARLQVGTTVSRRTVAELPEVARRLEGLVDLWSLFFLVPTGRAETADMLDADEHEQVLRWLARVELPFAVRTIAAPTYRRVRAQLGREPGPGVNDGNGFAFVSHVGDVCPSGFLPRSVGNVRDAPLSHWYREAPLFTSLRDPEQLGGKCGHCEYRAICGGSRARAWALTDNALAADPTCSYVPAAT
jgi:radical SAM protein with 4Fe4S-binding SPASM domain